MLMLTYVKEILHKVSFDPKLFEKELRKAIKAISAEDFADFKRWCYNHFGGLYQPTLDRYLT